MSIEIKENLIIDPVYMGHSSCADCFSELKWEAQNAGTIYIEYWIAYCKCDSGKRLWKARINSVKFTSVNLDVNITANTIDPRIVAAIKDRESRTDRYGDDLVFQVDHDLRDSSYVDLYMPEHKEGCILFCALSEDEQFSILREVLNEPIPDDYDCEW